MNQGEKKRILSVGNREDNLEVLIGEKNAVIRRVCLLINQLLYKDNASSLVCM
jgi:hypothetical protein